ncbi:hypothetical protein H5410_004340 [Solanum commersonii]|uniref:Reverse transcriptase domain-containing protein n=1 Tax=Solanum commersonii TaxID=4109 RepID=A0A9J6B868_SOLCO|nr:hypothetical protein H5410_004340 [Solanum commersonii]
MRRRVEKYRERKRDIHIVFIDLEMAYDKIMEDILWKCLEARFVLVLFADDIVLIDKTWNIVNDRTKMKCLECKFNIASGETNVEVRVSKKTIPKRESFKVVVSLSLLYGVECLSVKNSQVKKMHVVKVRILRCMCSNTSSDKIRDEVIWEKVRVANVADKMREARLR